MLITPSGKSSRGSSSNLISGKIEENLVDDVVVCTTSFEFRSAFPLDLISSIGLLSRDFSKIISPLELS